MDDGYDTPSAKNQSIPSSVDPDASPNMAARSTELPIEYCPACGQELGDLPKTDHKLCREHGEVYIKVRVLGL